MFLDMFLLIFNAFRMTLVGPSLINSVHLNDLPCSIYLINHYSIYFLITSFEGGKQPVNQGGPQTNQKIHRRTCTWQ